MYSFFKAFLVLMKLLTLSQFYAPMINFNILLVNKVTLQSLCFQSFIFIAGRQRACFAVIF